MDKGNDRHEDAGSLLQQVIANVCTKFQNPRCSNSCEIFKNFIGEKEKRTNKGNEKHDYADSLLHNTTCHTPCVYQRGNFSL